jgi:acyl-CoA synthetase (NDP forming)
MSTDEASRILAYEDGVEILARYGIPMANGGVAKSREEAVRIASKVGYPVALKAISKQVSHKTEANAIRLGVGSDAELGEAFDEVTRNLKRYDSKAEITGVLIQEMLRNGTEVIIGTSRDPQFGPVILFGLGGIFVEVLKDVSLRVLPITRYDAEEMVKEIKGYKVLEGFRGKPRADLQAIVEILMKVSGLSTDMKDWISELDLNPVIVLPEGSGAKVVDARFVVTSEPREVKARS